MSIKTSTRGFVVKIKDAQPLLSWMFFARLQLESGGQIPKMEIPV
jgi:hypothetical protein